MRLLVAVLLSAIVAISVEAQEVGFQNEALATRYNSAGTAAKLAVDKQGRLIIGSTLNGIYAEDSAFPASGSLMVQGGVNNRGYATTFNSTLGDATPLGVGDSGNLYSTLVYDGTISTANTPIQKEDSTVTSGDAGIGVFGQRLDQLATGQTGSNTEYAYFLVDTLSRQYVNAWGAAVTEFFSTCGTATATTADVAMKAAAGAGVRNYVTGISCKNTSATTATSLDFKDGTTAIAAGGIAQMATASPGSFTMTFNTPLRGSANTAVNFATNVSTTSVVCCATGFTSPY